MADREKVIGLLQETAELFRECRNNVSFASKAENHFWELQNAANEAVELLKEQEAVKPIVTSAEERCGNCNKVIEAENLLRGLHGGLKTVDRRWNGMPDMKEIILQKCKNAIDFGEPIMNYSFYYDVIDLLKELEAEKKCCRDCEYYGACHDK